MNVLSQYLQFYFLSDPAVETNEEGGGGSHISKPFFFIHFRLNGSFMATRTVLN